MLTMTVTDGENRNGQQIELERMEATAHRADLPLPLL